MQMAWYYALPQAERDRLEREVYIPVTDAVIAALDAAGIRGGAETREIAEAAGQVAMWRDLYPFVRSG